MLQKKKPIRSKKNLESIRQSECLVCSKPPPNDPHHLVTRGARGGDEWENLVPLCRTHHADVHRLGVKTFIKLYSLPVSFESGWPRRVDLPENHE